MNKKALILHTIFLLILGSYLDSYAKRGPAPDVTPIIHMGTKYIAPNKIDKIGTIEAWDIRTNLKLWEEKIYKIDINPNKEKDVQWIFIKELVFDKGKIIVIREDGNKYSINTNR